MKKRFNNLFNAIKYRRRYNTYKLKYEEILESKIKDKEQIIELQNQVISLREENDCYQKALIEEFKKNITEIKMKYKKLKEKK